MTCGAWQTMESAPLRLRRNGASVKKRVKKEVAHLALSLAAIGARQACDLLEG